MIDPTAETGRVLGRGVIVAAGAAPPDAWSDAPRVVIDDAALRSPATAVDALHGYWSRRAPVVVEIGVDVDALRAPETETRALYELEPHFEFAREALYFLARSNNYDDRNGRMVWGPALEAMRLGATATAADGADVMLPDGRPAWCDGGPRAGAVPVPAGHVVVHRVRLDEGSLAPDNVATAALGLAPDQERAVGHDAGPARIIAPAGSGKTRVLTERFRLLVAGRGWGASSVCAVAYNVRAKDEMHRRLGDVGDAARAKVRTLHSLGFAIVRAGGPVTDVIDERGMRDRIEPLVPVRFKANVDVHAPYLEALGEARQGLLAPEQVEAKRDDVEGFAAMFHAYRDRLRVDRVLDHDEQIYGAVETLLHDPTVRARFRRECRHLLVDEFQDLTPAQLMLIRLVAAPAYDVFGVGDDDQVIYGYAGADPDFLISYDRYIRGADAHDLEVNYRCPPPVVDAARTLLSHNRRRVPKAIRAAKPDAPASALDVRSAPPERLAHVALESVQEWMRGGASPDSIAVLARVNAALLPIQVLCADAGIPCWAAVEARVLERTGMRAALAYLRIAGAVADESRLAGRDVATALRRPPRSIPRPTLERIERRQWTVESLASLASSMSGRAADRFDEFVEDVSALGARLAGGAGTAAVLTHVRDQIGLGRALAALDGSGRGPDASHGDDLNALIAVAAMQPDPRRFEAWLRDRLQTKTEGPAVALSTVHRVKGMEWPFVVVLGAHDGLMPHTLADDVEEERRIFHVAITRCSESVRVLVEETRPIPFVEQMRTPFVERPIDAVAPVAPKPARIGNEIVAAEGLVVTFAGSTGPIMELRTSAAVLEEGSGAKVQIPYGERVEIDGRRYRLAAPALPEEPIDESLFDALRAWRLERSRADRVPAFTVLHDAHLQEIARRTPTSLRELAACPGIGPTKLERYGDEILAVLDARPG